MERYLEDYKENTIAVNGQDEKWGYEVSLRDFSDKSKVCISSFTSKRIYKTKEEAMLAAKQFIDNKK